MDCTVDVAEVWGIHGLLVTAADPGMVMNTDAADVCGCHCGGRTVLGSTSLVLVSPEKVVKSVSTFTEALFVFTGDMMEYVS